MPSECSLSRRRGSLLRQAQDGELAEPQPRSDWRRLRTCATREADFGNTNQGKEYSPPTIRAEAGARETR